jgi:hypothetical protein
MLKGVIYLLGLLTIGCGNSDDGKRDNPFTTGGSIVEVQTTSNADTLFLSWKPGKGAEGLEFDHYLVEESTTGTSRQVTKEASECIFTRLPYNEVFSVDFSAVNAAGETVGEYKLSAKISGLDTAIAREIIRDKGSVTGGDGMYSIALPDGRSIFLMGDSWLGEVINGQRSTSGNHMYRNTYIVWDEGKVSAIADANGPNTSGAVPPGVTNESQKWYWPGHGFVVGDRLYIFQTLMYQGADGMWGFMYETTHILEYKLPEIELVRTQQIPFRGSTDIHYGMAALNDGAYLYIYAQVDVENDIDPIAEVLAARTTESKLYTEWEYYTGTGWSANPGDAAKLSGLASVPISSQFNVFKLRDKYVLLAQNKAFNSSEIYTFVSDTPVGPWRNKKLIFRTYEQTIPNMLTYNAMAHPQFERDGMILVSYNVNTLDFSQQFSDVSTYRPRFFWMPVDKILN